MEIEYQDLDLMASAITDIVMRELLEEKEISWSKLEKKIATELKNKFGRMCKG